MRSAVPPAGGQNLFHDRIGRGAEPDGAVMSASRENQRHAARDRWEFLSRGMVLLVFASARLGRRSEDTRWSSAARACERCVGRPLAPPDRERRVSDVDGHSPGISWASAPGAIAGDPGPADQRGELESAHAVLLGSTHRVSGRRPARVGRSERKRWPAASSSGWPKQGSGRRRRETVQR
jgi:hypothetical protein